VAGKWRHLGVCGAAIALSIGVIATELAAAPPRLELNLSPAESLVITADSNSLSCARYRARNWLRQKFVRDDDLTHYCLRMDDRWECAPETQPVVILVHGFNSTPAQNAALMKPIGAADLPWGTFAYPNDHTLPASAQLLSCELKRFAARYPRRRVVLVCHSMGSLVARACIENPLCDPGNVDRLIMIAPPTHGTLIAHFAVGTDLWEHWLARRDGGPWRRTRDSIVDGLGEAADDLCPGSEFLHELNGRPLNPRVRYTILLGTGGCLDDAQVAWIRETVCEKLAKVPGADGSAERLAAILNDIDELVEGKGDGIVAVKRGRLDGVSDTLVLPFGHMSVTGEPRDDEVLRQVQQEVLARIR
jgi:pimeloyl-ACP methyl ester carboxylesterase